MCGVVPVPSVVDCCRAVELDFWAVVTERGSARKCRSCSNAAQLALALRGAVWALQPQPFVLTLGTSISVWCPSVSAVTLQSGHEDDLAENLASPCMHAFFPPLLPC